MADDDDIVRLLVATDNHLGYMEKDPIRGGDSYAAFEEILQLSREKQVDAILLGGDLFHDNKPSRQCMHRTLEILRKYTMGDRPVKIQILSDQSLNFKNKQGRVNYEDPNYNIDMPIFTIHGNHDDPTREGSLEALSALDLLSVSNLVNYFGTSNKVDDISIYPILIAKGSTKIALYGLGSVRDERLNRMFTQKKVKFVRPVAKKSEWFNVFVLHQNRDNRGRGAKNCIHESMIPEFMDFVVWGHEHECDIEASDSLKGRFHVSQPGSSVATSLVEGEAKRKHVGILEIKGDQFRLVNHALQKVRPFVMDEVVLTEIDGLDSDDTHVEHKVKEFLVDKLYSMIDQATEHFSPAPGQELPLIRLKVEHTRFPTINTQRFGGEFVNKVANPNDILLFSRKRTIGKRQTSKQGSLAKPVVPDALDKVNVEDLASSILEESEKKLRLLPEPELNEALQNFVHKQSSSAISEIVDSTLEEMQLQLNRNVIRYNSKTEDIASFCEKAAAKIRAEHKFHTEANEPKRGGKRPLQEEGQDQSKAPDHEGNDDQEGAPKRAKITQQKRAVVSKDRARRKRSTPSRVEYVDSDEEYLQELDENESSADEGRKKSARKSSQTKGGGNQQKHEVVHDNDSADEFFGSSNRKKPERAARAARSGARPQRVYEVEEIIEDDAEEEESYVSSQSARKFGRRRGL